LFEGAFAAAACGRSRECIAGGKTSTQAIAGTLFMIEERNLRRFMVIPSVKGKGLGPGRSAAVFQVSQKSRW
jgi:hypothetical protein